MTPATSGQCARAELEAVRRSLWRVEMMLDGAGWGAVTKRCVDFPRLYLSHIYPRRRGSKVAEKRVFMVEGLEGEFPDLASAVAAMNAVDEPVYLVREGRACEDPSGSAP
ncbi:MAG TPA: hypothetical protein VFA50_16185 [Stellaceae bacterium]|nr:hypothetical protein [Stellaceae bacterium]